MSANMAVWYRIGTVAQLVELRDGPLNETLFLAANANTQVAGSSPACAKDTVLYRLGGQRRYAK
ncbi:hypothetical protein AGMMS49944_18140 [Spirochaetia bacterium]|nr:hypothetical protein AGMMS49944_18140 [Spirochaetia bacterium]